MRRTDLGGLLMRRGGERMSGDGWGRVDRDDLLARVDLEQLLDALSGRGERNRWRCPDRDHPDEHASVTVRVGPGGVPRWRCWSGGHGGTAVDAVVAAHGLDAGRALRWLAERYTNLPVLERPPPAPIAPVGRPAPEVAVYGERAAVLLWTAAGRPQREWLAARGLREPVLRANRVGADPGRRFLPRPRGMPGGWPAVVYPALTPTGAVAYVQARYLEPPAGRSKYDNPAARLAANPRLAWTVPVGAARPGLLMVCEGTADALVAAQAGFRAVGVLGATYAESRVADGIAAARHPAAGLADTRVVVCFDDDPSGHAGSARLSELLAARAVPVSTLTPPDGLDLTGLALVDPAWPTTLPATETLPTATQSPPAPRGGPVFDGPELGLALGEIS